MCKKCTFIRTLSCNSWRHRPTRTDFETENSLFYFPSFRAWKIAQRLNFEARVFKFALNERSTCLLKHWFVKNEQLYEYCPVILDERDVTCGRFASVRCKTWASIRANWTIISWPKTFVFHYQTPRSTDLCEMKFIVQ